MKLKPLAYCGFSTAYTQKPWCIVVAVGPAAVQSPARKGCAALLSPARVAKSVPSFVVHPESTPRTWRFAQVKPAPLTAEGNDAHPALPPANQAYLRGQVSRAPTQF